MLVLFLIGPARQAPRDLGLDLADAVGPAAGQGAAGQHLLGRVVELAQQGGLPAVPDIGTDGANVAHRQHQQQPEPLRRLYEGGEILDGLGVHQVALEGGARHGEVMAHQPGHGLGLGGAETETRTDLQRHVGTQHRMIAAAALGDVVQQHREIERRPRQHLVHHVGRQRVVFLQLARLDARQDADGPDRVLVDGVGVIHVVLRLGDDAAEVGNEPAEHAGLIEAPERGFRVVPRRHHRHEQAIGLGIGAQPIDQADVLGDEPERRGMDVEIVLLRDVEQPQDRHRILRKGIGRRHRQPLAVELEALELARPESLPESGELRLAPVAVLQRGHENARQIAHRLGVKIVVLGEALDAAAARPVLVAQPFGDLALQVERQAIVGAGRQVVDVAAHRRQEALGALEQPRLLLGEHALGHEVAGGAHAIEILGDPEQQVEIAQAALALLDVGLDDVA